MSEEHLAPTEPLETEAPQTDAPAEETQQAPAPVEKPAVDPEVADLARAWGWKSPDEWQGEKPAGYIDDPEAYVNRFSKLPPVKNLQSQVERMAENQRKMEVLFQQALDRQRQAERQSYEEKLEQIRRQQREAVADADMERYDQLDQQARKLHAPEPEPQYQQADPVEPFKEAHPWLSDGFLREQGARLLEQAVKTGKLSPAVGTQEQVEFAAKQLRVYFPHLFQQPSRPSPQPSPVEGAGQAIKRRDGFDSLPAEAKASFKKFVAEGLFTDDAQGRKRYYDSYTAA